MHSSGGLHISVIVGWSSNASHAITGVEREGTSILESAL